MNTTSNTTSSNTNNLLHSKPTKPLLLEHINLNIPDETLAREFYIHTLGGVENPVSTNSKQLHVNVGSSQFHLLLKTKTNVIDETIVEDVTIPQHWPGYIELWTMEDLEDVRKRLPLDRCFYLSQDKHNNTQHDKLICICPWKKNYFLLKRAPTNFTVTHVHPGGYGTLIAMHRLVHPVSSVAIDDDDDDTIIDRLSKFWNNVMGCVTTSIKEVKDDAGGDDECDDIYESLSFICSNNEPNNSTTRQQQQRRRRRRCCIVHFESGQELVLEQSPNAPPYNSYDIQNDTFGYHLCLYLPTDAAFQYAFQQVEKYGILYANPRFAGGDNPAFGNAVNWKEAVECGQFRVKDWLWCDEGEERKNPPLVMELEVRSKKHICCPIK